MGGAAARAPVAMTARRKRSARPSTVTVSRPVNRPSPRNTSTPSSRKRGAPSTRLRPARSRRIRAMTAAKSPGPVATGPPKTRCDSAAACHDRAAAITLFEGTQPTLRQSPPMRCRSTRATRAPRPAATAAVTRPPVPPPTTTRW